MRGKRNRCSVFVCVWERERAHVCIFVSPPPPPPHPVLLVRRRASVSGTRRSSVCVACVHVCVWLDRGVGVLYWKLLLSSPVQHAGLAPAVSHGAVPPSPPAHLHKAQTGGDVTNKPGTQCAGCLLYMNPFPLSRHDKKEKRTHLRTYIHNPRFLTPDCTALYVRACSPPGDHSKGMQRAAEGEKGFHCSVIWTKLPRIQASSPSFFSSSKMVMFTLKHLYCTVAT